MAQSLIRGTRVRGVERFTRRHNDRHTPTRANPGALRRAAANAVESLEDRRLLAVYFVNFTAGPLSSTPSNPIVDVTGYMTDIGTEYGNRGDRNQPTQSYGWIRQSDLTPYTNERSGRNRNDARAIDERYDSFNHMQKTDAAAPPFPQAFPSYWDIAVPNGTYGVRIVSGDVANVDSRHVILAEGVPVMDVDTNGMTAPVWVDRSVSNVVVSDGNLTVSFGAGAANAKLTFIEIADAAPAGPGPTNVTATPLGLNSIRVNWDYTPNAARDESGYRVERSLDGVSGWQTVATLNPLDLAAAANRTFTNTGLDPGTTYHYRVSTFNPGGANTSVSASATTQAISPGTLGGTVAASTGNTNLTTEGNLDWVHWGFGGDPLATNALTAPPSTTVHNYAFEAEEGAAITDDNGDGDIWRVIDTTTTPSANGATTTASKGMALYADGAPTLQPADDSIATWLVTMPAAGTYRLYYRNRVFDRNGGGLGDNDSVYTATTGSALDATPSVTSARSNAEYGWLNTNVDYVVPAPGTYSFKLGLREGGYILDRIVLSTNNALSGTALDALPNTNDPPPSRGQEGPITDFTLIGNGTPAAIDSAKTFTWSNGGPSQSATNNDDAVAVSGAGNGFRIRAPLTTFDRKLRVYVGANNARGVLTARFRYGNTVSQETVIGELDATGQGARTGVFEITYSNPTPGGVLEVDYVAANDGGDVSLHAATYVEFIAPAPLTDLTAKGTGKGRVALAWTDNAINETGYVVQRAPDNGGQPGTFAPIATAAPNSRSYVDTGLADNTRFHYRVIAVNAVNAASPVPGSTPVVSATTVPLPVGVISGVRGSYFDFGGSEPADPSPAPPPNEQVNFTGWMSARVEDGTAPDGGAHRGPIDFAWADNAAAGTGYPGGMNLTDQNYWSSRFDGTYIPDFDGLHTFHTNSDDGARLYLDINRNGAFEANERIINNWVDQGLSANDADLDGSHETAFGHPDWLAGIPLVAGQHYKFMLEHYEAAGGSGIKLFASSPFQATPTIIPTASTFIGAPDTTAPTVTGFKVDGQLPAGMAYTPDAHVGIVFSEDIGNTLEAADIFLTDGVSFYGPNELAVHGYDAATNTAYIKFPGLPNRELANGNWQLTINDFTVTDLWGNPLDGDNIPGSPGGTFLGNFYFNQGDTQQDFYGNPKPDRVVNFVDYQRLQKNFGMTNPSHADGDFNHDGVIDNADFLILRSQFGTTVAPPPAAPVGATAPTPTRPKAPAPKTPMTKSAAAASAAPAPVKVAPVVKPKAPVARFATRKISDVLA